MDMPETKTTSPVEVIEHGERTEIIGKSVPYLWMRDILDLVFNDPRLNTDPDRRLVLVEDPIKVGHESGTFDFKVNIRLTRLVNGAVRVEINQSWYKAILAIARL